MWAGKGTEEELEGMQSGWKKFLSSEKSIEDIILEYLRHNPLYCSYQPNTLTQNQFKEYIRFSGYGEYNYILIDKELLQALVAWSDEDADQVLSVLQKMWQAFQPLDDILMVDFLRNAILTRCRNVFAADPDMLIHTFIAWLKEELIDKGRAWNVGNRQISLKLPDTVPLSFCIQSAANVSPYSGKRKDQILISALARFNRDEPSLVKLAAQIYNSDKPILDLTLPLELEDKAIEAWQIGIINNASNPILLAMLGQLKQKET
jgi:hypothetical protein